MRVKIMDNYFKLYSVKLINLLFIVILKNGFRAGKKVSQKVYTIGVILIKNL